MRIISLVNQKGGVGKTTTTNNLGASLVKAGKRVLLIDLDPQANLSYSLGVRGGDYKSVYDVLRGTAKLKDIILTHKNGVDIAPSHINLSGVELELASQVGREQILKDALKGVADNYDYVLIDCAPSLGIITLNALVASKEVFIPVQTEVLALQGMSQLLKTINLVRERLNSELKVTGVIGTMYDSRKKLSEEVMESLNEHFSGKLFKTLIRSNVSLAESPSSGVDIISYKADSYGAKDYQALAEEVIKQEDK